MTKMDLYFKVLASSASFASGTILNDATGIGLKKVIVNRGIRDTDENNGKGVQETYVVQPTNSQLIPFSSTPCVPKAVAQCLSPSGAKEVFFNNKPTPGGEPSPSVEIVHHLPSSGNFGSVKLDLSTYHGTIVGDAWFGGVSWSSDELYVAYVAKLKAVKKTTAVEGVTSPPTPSPPLASGPSETVNKYDFVDDWGEKYVDVSNLGVFILSVTTGSVVALPNVDINQWTIGQPQFIPLRDTAPGKYQIVYTAWNTLPRRLGMIYCYQRPCSIFFADITDILQSQLKDVVVTHTLLSAGIRLARSPRVSPDGRSLVFLGNRQGYLTHGGCTELFRVALDGNLETIAAETIVSAVDVPTLLTSSKKPLVTIHRQQHLSFPGLYLDQLPIHCFLTKNGDQVILSSAWGCVEEILIVDVTAKTVQPLTQLIPTLGETLGLASLQVLDTSMGVNCDAQATADVLFAFSAPNAPARLGWLTLNLSAAAASTWSFGPASRLFSISNKINLLQSSTSPADATQSLSYHVYLHHDSEGIPFESILLTPTDATSSLPLVLVPHGGPHSCFTTAFVASYVFLAKKLGAAVLFVNYRGSTGYGQRSIHSLAGTIGTNDVQDMMTCLQHALSLPHPTQEHLPWFNTQQVAVCGGSHGGFLGAHLSAQYPDVFHAAALRNPVTDIAAMVGISDIPDWCYVESLGVDAVETSQCDQSQGFDWGNPSPSLAHLTRMREVSPVHVPSVTTAGAYKTPTLVCLGMKDRRVPPSQGVAFYQLLKLYHGAHVPLSLMTFPDDVHAIDLPTTEAEHWMAIAQWIQTHLHL